MSSQKTVTVAINAKDGASKVFLALGKNAQTAAGQLNNIGKTAATDLGKVETSAKGAASSLDVLADRSVKVGAALGGAVAVLAKLGAQAEEQRRQVAGIGAAYGDASGEILRFTDAIQGSTRFSNEDARAAAQTAATLAQNYGFTAAEVEKLISVSADLATVHGTTLADATQRLSAAMRGETEGSEALGLTLNQQAIDREGLTLTMTNQEAAHFRLNAALDQAAYAEGQAGKQAETAAGQAAQFANKLQDVTTNAGAALGPLAASASVLGDMALILPVVGSGMGKLSSLIGTGGVLGALNPLTLALGGATIAIGLLSKAVWDYHVAADEAADPTDTLTEALIRLQLAGQDTSAAQAILDKWKSASAGMEAATAAVADLTAAQERMPMAGGLGISEEDARKQQEQINQTKDLRDGQEALAASVYDRAQAERDLNTIISHSGPNQKIVLDVTSALVDEYINGQRTGKDFAAQIRDIAANIDTFGVVLKTATERTIDLTGALDAQEGGLKRNTTAAYEMAAAYDAMVAAEAGSRAIFKGTEASGAGLSLINTDTMADEQAAIERGTQLREEDARVAEEQARVVEQAASDMRTFVEDVVQAQEQAAHRAEQIADINKRAAEEQADAAATLAAARKDADRGYTQAVKSAAKERVQVEKDAAAQIKDLDKQRLEIAADVQDKLADLATRRTEIEQGAMADLADAQAAYAETQADTAQAQQELRKELAESVADATKDWREAVKENKKQLAEIAADLRKTIADLDRDFTRSLSDIQTERTRAGQDLMTTLADPNVSNEDKNAAIDDYKRQLEDLATEEQRLREDNARDEKEARAAAAQAAHDANVDKKKGAQDYHDTVAGLESDATERIKDLQGQAADAAQVYHDKVTTIRNDEATQLSQLAADQKTIAEDAGAAYEAIELEKRSVANETASQLRQLDNDTASAAKIHQHEVTDAQRDYNEAIATSVNDAKTALSDIEATLTPLEQALRDGYLTKNQFDRIMEAAPDVTAFYDDLEARQAAQQGKALIDVKLLPDEVKSDPAWDAIVNESGPFGADGVTVTVKATSDISYTELQTQLDSLVDETYVAKIDVERADDFEKNKNEIANDLNDQFTNLTYWAGISVEGALNYDARKKLVVDDLNETFTETDFVAGIDVARGENYDANLRTIVGDLNDRFPETTYVANIGIAKGATYEGDKATILADLKAIDALQASVTVLLDASPDMTGGKVGEGSPSGFAPGAQSVRDETDRLDELSATVDLFLATTPAVAGVAGAKGVASGFAAGAQFVRDEVAALDKLAATVDTFVNVDMTEATALEAWAKQLNGDTIATVYIDVVKRKVAGTADNEPVPSETPTTGPPRKQHGGDANGWFIAGDPGAHWEAIYAPGGATVLTHQQSVAAFGGGYGGMPAYAKGGKPPPLQAQGKRHGKASGHPGKGGAQFSPEFRKLVYTKLTPGEQAFLKSFKLTGAQKQGLMDGTLAIGTDASGNYAIIDQGQTGYNITFHRGAGKNSHTPDVSGGGAPAPKPKPPPPPPPAALPVPEKLPTTPTPLPTTQIAADLPLFTGESSPFAIEGAARATLEQQQREAVATLEKKVTAQRAEGDQTSGITSALRELRRELAELRRSISDIASGGGAGNPLQNYGTMYVQGGPDLNTASNAARSASTALRFG
jgi:hypothetical protein